MSLAGYDVEYVKWVAHFDNSDAEKFKGCVLGIRETFMRLKKDSWYDGVKYT